MQFLVRIFGGVDVIKGKLNYELHTLDPETGTLLTKTFCISSIWYSVWYLRKIEIMHIFTSTRTARCSILYLY